MVATYSFVEHFNKIRAWGAPHGITDVEEDVNSIGTCFEVFDFRKILLAVSYGSTHYERLVINTFRSHTLISPLPRPAHTWLSTTISSWTESTHWGLSCRLKSATFNMAPLSLSVQKDENSTCMMIPSILTKRGLHTAVGREDCFVHRRNKSFGVFWGLEFELMFLLFSATARHINNYVLFFLHSNARV